MWVVSGVASDLLVNSQSHTNTQAIPRHTELTINYGHRANSEIMVRNLMHGFETKRPSLLVNRRLT